jgi:hypothetical protein
LVVRRVRVVEEKLRGVVDDGRAGRMPRVVRVEGAVAMKVDMVNGCCFCLFFGWFGVGIRLIREEV